jgi:hypothetical protein
MFRPTAPVLFLLSLQLAGQASADTQDVLFNATVAAVCTLSVNSNGTMAASADLQTLSSKLGGGSAASLTLSTTGGVDLSLDPVTVVDAPAADVTATSWAPTYAASGAHTIAETAGTTSLAAPGTSTLSIHLIGTKGGTDRFSAGNYEATVTVRCE